MTPFQKFVNGIHAAQLDINEVLTELKGFAEVMARKSNSVELDEDGFFYVTAAGPLDEIIPTMEKQMNKLNRIKRERDGT